MSATASKIGYGITLSHSTTSGGSYTALAEILELTPPQITYEDVKVYRSDNTVAIVEKLPGWGENSDTDATVTYIPATRTTLDGLKGVPGFWKVTYPLCGVQTVADTDGFAGYIKMVGPETPLKDAMKCKIKVTVSGPVTFTVGT